MTDRGTRRGMAGRVTWLALAAWIFVADGARAQAPGAAPTAPTAPTAGPPPAAADGETTQAPPAAADGETTQAQPAAAPAAAGDGETTQAPPAAGDGETTQAPPAAAPAAPADEEAIQALLAEVRALGARVEELEAQAVMSQLEGDEALELVGAEEPFLSLYGFMDFGYDRFFLSGGEDDDVGVLRPTSAGSFIFGNLNLYVHANLTRDFQSLFELRFTTAPNGEEIGFDPPIGERYERIDTTAFDYSSPAAQTQLRLGSVFFERAWTEWRQSDWLQVRAGLFLNPFGIWNVDHGSPTLIALGLPTFVAGQMMPSRLLGLQALGAWNRGRYRVGYAAHVSNGRTPNDYDLTDDKAFGGRITVRRDGDESALTLGVSTYMGSYADQVKKVDLVAATSPEPDGFFDWQTVTAYDEYVWGLDLSYDWGPLRARAEGVGRWIYYEEGKRELAFSYSGGERYTPDRFEWDAYGLIAYTTPFRLEPYVMVEGAKKAFVLPRFAGEARATITNAPLTAMSLGLNIRLHPRVLFKSQFQIVDLFEEHKSGLVWRVPVIFTRLVSTF